MSAEPLRRNPPWERDELILALNLYLREGAVGGDNPQILALSEQLNGLPLHPLRSAASQFRSANAVALKLANFAALDPSYRGTGMVHGGRRDREVWSELASRPHEVAELAGVIRAEADQQTGSPLAPEEGEEEAVEGRLLYRRHRGVNATEG